jgi:hypothetical protein
MRREVYRVLRLPEAAELEGLYIQVTVGDA